VLFGGLETRPRLGRIGKPLGLRIDGLGLGIGLGQLGLVNIPAKKLYIMLMNQSFVVRPRYLMPSDTQYIASLLNA